MFFIFGWGRTTKDVLGWTPPRMCGVCHNKRPWVVARIRHWFSVFFIPLIPYDSRYVAMCPVCSHGLDLDRSGVADLVQAQSAVPGKRSVGPRLIRPPGGW